MSTLAHESSASPPAETATAHPTTDQSPPPPPSDPLSRDDALILKAKAHLASPAKGFRHSLAGWILIIRLVVSNFAARRRERKALKAALEAERRLVKAQEALQLAQLVQLVTQMQTQAALNAELAALQAALEEEVEGEREARMREDKVREDAEGYVERFGVGGLVRECVEEFGGSV